MTTIMNSARRRARALSWISLIVISISILTLAGCASRLPAAGSPSRPLPSRTRTLRVGVAKAQITPPPGVSLFGHGPNSLVASGVWTRLYCRAFLFEGREADVTPELLAIVACDLPAISTLLQREVVRRARRSIPRLSAPRLLLTATHTHAGPGHYFGSAGFNGAMSSRMPGFDDNMVKFLAERIALALERAHDRLEPARLAWRHVQHWNLTRNRSLLPFRLNRRSASYRAVPEEGVGRGIYWRLPEDRKAIDPRLDTLWIYGSEGSRLLGAITFLAMHPTMLGPSNRLFGGDIFGVVSRWLDHKMRSHNNRDGGLPNVPPQHAIINTNEGDISPVSSAVTIVETEILGRRLALRIWRKRAEPGEASSSAVLGIRYTEVELPSARVDERRSLCSKAELGKAAPKGASDHATPLVYLDTFRDAHLDRRPCCQPCQEPKRPMLGALQTIFTTKYSFPRWAPLAVVQLRGTLIAFVPAELTVTAGHRVTEALAAKAAHHGLGVDHVIIGGLTNGYILYVTTAEEYEAQHYEGSSNLYGPNTADLLKLKLEELVDALAAKNGTGAGTKIKIDHADAHPYKVDNKRERLPLGKGEVSLAELGTRRRELGLCRMPGFHPPALCYWWLDGAPGRVWWKEPPEPPKDRWPIKERWLELAFNTGKVHDDDRTTRFTTRARQRGRGNDRDGWIWSTIYRFSRDTWSRAHIEGGKLRLRAADKTRPVESAPFTTASLHDDVPPCKPAEALFCAGKLTYDELLEYELER